MNKLQRHFFSRLWLSDHELSKFSQLMGILLLGVALFVGLYIGGVYNQQKYLLTLQREFVESEARNAVLLKINSELERINAALLPTVDGLDWETVRFLSFKNLQLIGENEGIAYIKEFE